MKNNIPNDLDDASKKAFIKKEYEKLEAKVRNVTSRTQLASIIADAGNLALIASQYGIDIGGVLELIATAVSKTVHYETEQIQEKDFNEGVTSAEEQEKIDREQKALGIYKSFDSFYLDSLNRQRKDNENLHEVYEATKAGRELTEEEKKKYKKTPEEIAEEKARSQHMELTKKQAEKDREYYSNEIKKIEEREKQLAHLSENHPERLVLANQKKHCEDHHGLVNKKIEEYNVYHTERKQHAHNICLGTKLAKETGINEDIAQNFAAEFQEIHGVSHEKIDKELTIKEQQQQAFITLSPSKDQNQLSSESPAILHAQQELKTKQITPDKNGNKLNEYTDNIKKALIGKGHIQQIQSETGSNKTPSITPNSNIHDLKQVNKRDRW